MATQPTPSAPPRVRPRREGNWARLAEPTFLLLLFALSFLVRLWPMWKVHWWDETVYLQNAEYICCGKHNYSEFSSRPPLLSIIYAGVFLLWNTPYAASVLAAALNALGPLCLYWAGKMLHGRPAGVIGALLLGFAPFFVYWGNTLVTDSPALTLTLLAFCLVLKAVATDKLAWFGMAGFATGLSGLMRFPALITVAIFPIYFLRDIKFFKRAAGFGFGLLLSFGPYLLWSWLAYGSPLATLHNAMNNVAGSVEPGLYYVRNFGEIFPWVTLAGLVLWLAIWLRGLLATTVAGGKNSNLHSARQSSGARLGSDAILWAWAALVLLYFSRVPHKELRYVIPLAAPLFLLAGRGLAVLTRPASLPVRTAGLGILALALGYSFAPLRHRLVPPFFSPYVSEEKDVADYLNQQANPAGWLYTNFNYPVFGYYTRLKLDLLREQDMSFYAAFPQNMPENGYLIIYKKFPREPTVAWVDADPHFRRLKEFPSLVVYEYRRAGFP